jgi:hypothetical protein
MNAHDVVAKIASEWGKPPDRVAWTALVIAGLVAFRAMATKSDFSAEITPQKRAIYTRRFVLAVAMLSAFLSLGYIAHYLRGGPRIIDATEYFLQARAIMHGGFAWHVTLPSESVRGRFLLFREPDIIAGIFPPGYPILLSLGFFLGAPMVVGPVLAIAITITTSALAGEMARHIDVEQRFHISIRAIERCAALASLVCVTLRYHTADTMAHGASALAIALALTFALRGARFAAVPKAPPPRNKKKRVRAPVLDHAAINFAIAGLAIGYVATTRLASAPAIAIVVFAIAWNASHARGSFDARSFAIFASSVAVAIVPGFAVLLWSQHEATGNALLSTQRAYYAVSDGPPGCFRYGFGANVGCTYEHGDFVEAQLAHGYGFVEAALTTSRRLVRHLGDVANFEPLALLVLIPIARTIRGPSRVPLYALALVVLHIAFYAPFYFDGNYPGGGARFYADILPVEHALIAIALVVFASRVSYSRCVGAFVALALAGFALHSVRAQIALADRDGGAPMYEPDVPRAANITHGVVFFDTDHGFDLAYEPGVDPQKGLLAARFRDDDHDRLLLDHLGRPPAYQYKFEGEKSSIVPWSPSRTDDSYWSFESEADWPPLAQSGGWAIPQWMHAACASKKRVLTLFPDGLKHAAEAVIALDVPYPGKWSVSPSITRRGGAGEGDVRVVDGFGVTEGSASTAPSLASWSWRDRSPDPREDCAQLAARTLTFRDNRAYLVVRAHGGDVSLDRTELTLAR